MSDCPVCVGIEGYAIHTCGAEAPDCPDFPMPPDMMADRIAELESKLATAEADAGRLDWLDRNLQMKTGWRVGVAKAGNIVVTSVGLSETTIRAAIDAAIAGDSHHE